MKKTLAVILAILMMTSLLCTGAYADGETMELSVTSATGHRGDEVTITVSIISNPTIMGLQADIQYDTEVLEKVSFKADMPGMLIQTKALFVADDATVGSSYVGPGVPHQGYGGIRSDYGHDRQHQSKRSE